MTDAQKKPKPHIYDIVLFGGGVAGLWLCNTLKRAGYNVILVEKDKLGGGQTLASQGMIHGGQKYVLQGALTQHASSLSKMPDRWNASLEGWGEIDLTAVQTISETQVMWPAGSVLSDVAVLGAAKLVNADTRKLKKNEFPEVLTLKKKFKGPVFELPEKVLEVRSLVQALSAPLKGRVLRGELTELLPDGQCVVSGIVLRAQLLIFTAGTGNEDALKLLNVREKHAQRRPLRQVMVKSLPYALFGHGIVGNPKPRVTVTSHADGAGGYVWYLGGALAEAGAHLSEDDTLALAQKEMAAVFPDIDWTNKEWATWQGDRAEPYDAAGDLPPGPFLHQRGRVLIAWPTKLTFAPALSDRVFDWLKDKDIRPLAKDAPPAALPTADIASYPWEIARWRTV